MSKLTDAEKRNLLAQADYASVMAKLNELLNRRSYIRNLVTNVAKELTEV